MSGITALGPSFLIVEWARWKEVGFYYKQMLNIRARKIIQRLEIGDPAFIFWHLWVKAMFRSKAKSFDQPLLIFSGFYADTRLGLQKQRVLLMRHKEDLWLYIAWDGNTTKMYLRNYKEETCTTAGSEQLCWCLLLASLVTGGIAGNTFEPYKLVFSLSKFLILSCWTNTDINSCLTSFSSHLLSYKLQQ